MSESEVNVKFGASIEGFAESMTQLREIIEGLTNPLTAVRNNLGELAEAFAAAFAVEQIVDFFKEIIEQTVELGDQFEHLMTQTGLTAEALSGLRLASQETGSSFESLSRAFTTFARNMSQAQAGSERQRAAFNSLGISTDYLKTHANDLAGMFELVAKKLNAYSDGGNKAQLISDIFSARMRDMGPLLKDVAEHGMAELSEHAAELGVRLDKETVESAVKAKKAFADFSAAVEGLKIAIGEHLLPIIQPLVEALTRIIAGPALVELEVEADKLKENIAGVKEEIVELKKESGQSRPTGLPTVLDQTVGTQGAIEGRVAQLERLEAQLEKIETRIHSIKGDGKEEDHDKKPDAPDVGAILAAKKAALEAEKAAIRDQKDLESDLNKELRDRLALVKENQSVSAAYYDRLKTEVREAARNGEISAGQEFEQLKVLENEKYALQQRAFENEKNLSGQGTKEYEKALAEQKVSTEHHYIELGKIDKDYVAQLNATWKSAVTTVEHAFSGAFESMIVQGLTFGQAMRKVFADLTLSAIQATGRLLLDWAAAQAKKLIIAEATNLGIKASDLESFATFFAKLPDIVAQWLGVETAKTAATETGAGIRAAAAVGEATAGKAAAVAAGFGQISIDAAVAAAGAMAAISAIPFIGPELAPEVAAATYTATIGWAAGLGGGLAAEEGALIPSGASPMVRLHQNEIVLPASLSRGIQTAVNTGSFGGTAGASGSSASGSGGGANVSLNVNAIDARSFLAFINQPTVMRNLAKQISGYLATNPGARAGMAS